MIAIVKYNAGNSRSVQNAVRILGYESEITDSPDRLLTADKIILPGVGEAGTAMRYLQERGIDQILKSVLQPVLGICLGMQLMCRWSEEGDTEGLGIFDTIVKRFPNEKRVPHTGWDNFKSLHGELFKNIADTDDLYYVHSYYAGLCRDTTAVCDYILPFSAALSNRNFYGTQFHPEKSATKGSQVLKNFLEL